MKNFKQNIEMGTKAETLYRLSEVGYRIPPLHYFTVEEWNDSKSNILSTIKNLFNSNTKVAVRSSSLAEDTEKYSMAGAFDSYLDVDTKNHDLNEAIDKVIQSFDKSLQNQVLIQEMVDQVIMSGVVMTKVLDDGSPYYVINYDDTTGKTDSVTSGNSINKTVYIYNGVKDKDFDSKLLLMVLHLVRSLEKTFNDIPIDIEFAISKSEEIKLLQVRKITTTSNWDKSIHKQVSSRIDFLKPFIQTLMKRRIDIYGEKTLLGIMPDWNPAEMIGIVPQPLATSLYRELITKRVWSRAREIMGYRKMPNVDLMVSLFGRPYIDVRNSINSFIPAGLNEKISEKMVNAYIQRLDCDPHLHDKIEFDIVLTNYDFNIDEKFNKWYNGILNKGEERKYKDSLRILTMNAIKGHNSNTLEDSLARIDRLKGLQKHFRNIHKGEIMFVIDEIKTLLEECIKYGTIPFSILARHGFIAESLLRSLVEVEAIKEERISLFKKSFKTVAGDMSRDLYKMKRGGMGVDEFFSLYGHLRPSSYDILSPKYSERKGIFDGDYIKPVKLDKFKLSSYENKLIQKILDDHKFINIIPQDIFDYAKKAIVGREYAKFIFTVHLSRILEIISYWGRHFNLEREEMSLLSINNILEVPYEPLHDKYEEYFMKIIELKRENLKIASSFKLSYLIRSTKDIHIVPVQRSLPNFIGNCRVEGEIVFLSPHSHEVPNLDNKIVCIEGADPGYDWIFTKNILGLITKYGGVNSHMAIRCAELGIPAAIGCGDQPIDRVLKSKYCILDCQKENLLPI